MKKILFILLLIPTFVIAQKSQKLTFDTVKVVLTNKSHEDPMLIHDTVRVEVITKADADSLQQVYFEILKNTNEQLNNYWSPLNIIITILSVLLGIGSIWAGLFIYAQGRDFRKQREEVFEKVKTDTESLSAELKAKNHDLKIEVERDLEEKNLQFEALLTSTREVMGTLAEIEIPEIKKVFVKYIKDNRGIVLTGGRPSQYGFVNCLFWCSTCDNIWKGTLGQVEEIYFNSRNDRPPVLRKCPKCEGDNYYRNKQL